MPVRSDEAFVLARYPYRERDLVVALLMRQGGQVRLLARRARGARAPQAAALEPLARIRVSYFEKGRSELASLDEAAVVRGSFGLAAQPEAWAAAQVVAELALTYCPPGLRQEPAFRLVDRCLEGLLAGAGPLRVASYAELWFLRLAGVFPDLDRCGACGASLTEPGRILDAGDGWFTCTDDAPARGGLAAGAAAVAWIRSALQSPVERLEHEPPRNCIEILTALRRRFTEREIRSWSYLSQLTAAPPGRDER